MSARGAGIAVILLTVAALGARLRGIDFLLPLTHLDGSVVVSQAHTLRDPQAERGANFKYYPVLLPRTVALLPDPGRTQPRPGLSTEEHVGLAVGGWRQVRQVSALWSVLLVPLTYLLATRFLARGWALFAAALVATSLLHATFGTQARPHGTATTCIFLSLLASLRLRDRGDVMSFLLAGAAAGAAIGALQYGIFALPPLALAFLLRRRAAPWPWILASAGLVALFVRWMYPFHFEGDGGFLTFQEKEGAQTLNLSGQPLYLEKFTGHGFPVIPETLWSYDPTLLVLGLFGCAVLLRRRALPADVDRRAALWIVLAHAMPYGLVIGLYRDTWERFVLQLLPWVAIVAAVGLSALPRGSLVAGASLVLPGALLWHLGSVRAAPDTFEQAAGWVRAELRPEGETLLDLSFDLPVLHSSKALRSNRKNRWYSAWVRYQMRLTPEERAGLPAYHLLLPVGKPDEVARRLREDPLGYARSLGADYVLVEETEPGIREHLAAARQALAAHGPPVFRATSARVDDGPARLQNVRIARADLRWPYVRRLAGAVRMGPALEVYRVPSRDRER